MAKNDFNIDNQMIEELTSSSDSTVNLLLLEHQSGLSDSWKIWRPFPYSYFPNLDIDDDYDPIENCVLPLIGLLWKKYPKPMFRKMQARFVTLAFGKDGVELCDDCSELGAICLDRDNEDDRLLASSHMECFFGEIGDSEPAQREITFSMS